MIKTSVSTYSFSKLISKGEMTQIDCISMAKEMGFDSIEISQLDCKDKKPLAYAEEFAKEAYMQNLPISNFCFGADFIHGSDGDIKAEIKRVKEHVDFAEIMGVKHLRHDALTIHKDIRSFDLALPVVADACREIAEYAALKGIATSVENHGMVCQGADRLERLFNTVNHSNFGILIDVGNFMTGDCEPLQSTALLAPYATFVHVKDFFYKSGSCPNPGEGYWVTRAANYYRATILGHGDVPVFQCLKTLHRAGYDGYVSIEFEGMEDTLDAIRIGLANLKSYIEML